MSRSLLLTLVLAACGGKEAPGDTAAPSTTDSDPSAGTDTDATNTDPTTTDPTNPGGGAQVDFAGTYDGVPFTMVASGDEITQIICNNAGLGLYQLRVRDADQTLQVWLDLVNPVEGQTYTWPDMGDQTLALGGLYDVWPPNTYNRGVLDHASISVTAFTVEERFAGSVDVAWVEDTANFLPAADVSGTFDITCTDAR